MVDTVSSQTSPKDVMYAGTVEPSTPNVQMSKLTIIKNLGIVCTCFVLSFTAFSGTTSLQTSLNAENKLGNHCLSVLHSTAVISNLFLATVVLYKLGLKWSLVVSLLMYAVLPASNYFSVWYSLYPGAIITGLFTGPIWNAKSAYLTLLGEKYAELSGESAEVVISLFFGIFYMIFRGSTFTGNVISSLVIHRPASTHVPSDDDDIIIRSLCGTHYCYEDLDVAFKRHTINSTSMSTVESIYHPTTYQRDLLFGIYVLCALLAVPLAAAIHPIRTSGEIKSVKIVDALLSTMRQMKDPKEIPLLPLSLLSGVSYAFIMGDYCVGFVTCSIGIDNVGFVIAVFGITAGLGSVLLGRLLKYIGRRAIFALGGLFNAAAIIGMLTWSPNSRSMVILCVFAGLWGVANAVWTSQLVAFIAFVYRDGPKEAAFTCNYLWQMGGIGLWFTSSTYMCLNVQIYVIAGILAISMVGYVAIELMLKSEEVKQRNAAAAQQQMMENAEPVSIVVKITNLSDESLDNNREFQCECKNETLETSS